MKKIGFLSIGFLAATFIAFPKNDAIQVTWNDTVSQYGNEQLHTYKEPIDALSVGLNADTVNLYVSGKLDNGRWTGWQELEIEKEFDPLLRESNLVLFPQAVYAVKIRGTTEEYAVHPIRISDGPIRIEYAAINSVDAPKILSRRQWGADDSLLYVDDEQSSSSRSDIHEAQGNDNGGSVDPSGRIKECEEAQFNFPQEFRVARSVTTGDGGRRLRWDRQYSKKVTLIAVHHTGMNVTGDARTALERMRALYQYHAQNRGWGDIGYHYVVSEDGQIFEGKAGGNYIVGGHAYCNNIGSVGIALMGNFESEVPPQAQMRALKWLIGDLADAYDINLGKSVTFHGKKFSSPVVGHGDLLSTSCPGYYVRETMSQVRRQVIAGNFDADISFPILTVKKPTKPSATKPTAAKPTTAASDGLRSAGDTTLAATPGAKIRFSLIYTPLKGAKRRERIAAVSRSNVGIGLLQEIGGMETRVSTALFAPDAVRAGETAQIALLAQAPRTPGSYSFKIGSVHYSLTVTRGGAKSIDTSARTYERTNTPTTYRPEEERPLNTPAVRTASSGSSSSSPRSNSPTSMTHPIRIKLTLRGGASLKVSGGTAVTLSISNDQCAARIGTRDVTDDIVTFTPEEFGVITVQDQKNARLYRGNIECRVIDGTLVLINELSLEDYMLGLAEEPDTEPYEKQRAFAIAARTYALWYLDDANRKFPGKPYDGSDSPAEFQVYSGMNFEKNNPAWVRAVKDTSGEVLTYKGQLIKPPYFSSSDGRTRSPSEAKWSMFPFAEIFASKPDPWCSGMQLRGHGVGMSGCGAEAQADEGKTGEEILRYYYPGTAIEKR